MTSNQADAPGPGERPGAPTAENARLKRIVADKELQIEALKELGRGNC